LDLGFLEKLKGMDVVAIILARGGSKGIPNKNIIDFCGKPLIAWTIEQLKNSGAIDSVWVSSDSETILEVAKNYGAQTISRPDDLAGDMATSEVGWAHAIEAISAQQNNIDLIVAPQVTSPLREPSDFANAISLFVEEGYQSLFSASPIEDFFIWERDEDNQLHSLNYDYKNRKRRQDIAKQYVENGSFYLFSPNVLIEHNNRFGGNIGLYEMEFWKMFEIDSLDDVKICSALMEKFLLGNNI